MGQIKNHAIVVSYWDEKDVQMAHENAMKVFDAVHKDVHSIVSPIIKGTTNSTCSFFVAPDGSKEGWSTSDEFDAARKEFLDWLQHSHECFCDYVEVMFGGDTGYASIVRDRESDNEKYNEEHPYGKQD